MNYKRLTSKTHTYTACEQCTYRKCQYCDDFRKIKKEAYNRLVEFEDKIENGTLVDLPYKCGDNAVAIIDTLAYPNAILNVKIKGLAYIVEDENGYITFQHISRVFHTEAEALKKLEELELT